MGKEFICSLYLVVVVGWGLEYCRSGDADSGNPERVFQGRESICGL